MTTNDEDWPNLPNETPITPELLLLRSWAVAFLSWAVEEAIGDNAHRIPLQDARRVAWDRFESAQKRRPVATHDPALLARRAPVAILSPRWISGDPLDVLTALAFETAGAERATPSPEIDRAEAWALALLFLLSPEEQLATMRQKLGGKVS